MNAFSIYMEHLLNPALFPGFSGFEIIGHGSYGVVYKAIHVRTGTPVAIKLIDRFSLLLESQRESFAREVQIQRHLDHPFIAQSFREVHDGDGVYLIMELASGGTLYDKLAKSGRMKDLEAQRIICEVLSAIRYLHKVRRIVHRDIKLENILLDSSGRVRIVDFGISGEVTPEAPLLATQCGSFTYAAPEVVRGHKYGPEVDIWSAGVCLYGMVTRSAPFYDKNARVMCERICGEPLTVPGGVSAACGDLLQKMLAKDPRNRITIDEIAEHPWIAGSRYSFYLSDEFMLGQKYRVVPKSEADVDKEVVAWMGRSGYAVDNMARLLLEGVECEEVGVYKSMRKQRIIAMMGSEQELRMMYQMRRQLDCTAIPRKRFASPPGSAQRIAAAAVMKKARRSTDRLQDNRLKRPDRVAAAKSMVVVSLNAQFDV